MIGLPNLGNTCYVNTALQCLWACDSFRNYVNVHDNAFSVSTVFESKRLPQRVHSYQNMIRKIITYIPVLDLRNQMDIHEFLSFYFDYFFETNKRVIRIQKPLLCTGNKRISYNLDAHWFNTYSEVCDLVYGQYLIQTTCLSCDHSVYNYESCSVLSLAIPQHQTCIDTCIDEYFSDTTVERKCDKCKYGHSVRKTFLCKCPDIIICCLKRFQLSGTMFSKQTTPIRISNTLNLHKFTKFNKSESLYKLKSIALHHGNLDDGHYNALICSGDDFVYIDDLKSESVSASKVNKVIASKNYMIFYERASVSL